MSLFNFGKKKEEKKTPTCCCGSEPKAEESTGCCCGSAPKAEETSRHRTSRSWTWGTYTDRVPGRVCGWPKYLGSRRNTALRSLPPRS